MKNFKEFVETALEGNGVQNDDQYCQENGEAKKISTTHLFNAEEEIFFNEYENDTFEKVVDETAEESSLEELQKLINTGKYQIEELTW